MPEIPDDYMRAMVVRIVPYRSKYWEDALQEASLVRWQYRDKPVTYQTNQIKWRVIDMLRALNGRQLPKPLSAASSLDVLVSSPDSHQATPLGELVPDERLETQMELLAPLLDVRQVLRHEPRRSVVWLMRNARGESCGEIGRSDGWSESWVAMVLRELRVRLREAVAA